MSSPNPIGPNDPRGNLEEPISSETTRETNPNAEEVEGGVGPNDPRGNKATATSVP